MSLWVLVNHFSEKYGISGGPGRVRTHNDLNANQVLYQLELQGQNFNELILRVHLDSNQDRRINSPQ